MKHHQETIFFFEKLLLLPPSFYYCLGTIGNVETTTTTKITTKPPKKLNLYKTRKFVKWNTIHMRVHKGLLYTKNKLKLEFKEVDKEEDEK
jgi:hypothetical protein